MVTKKNLEPGLLIPVNYIRAIDGDTIDVEIKTTFHVRLRDIDVIEKHSPHGLEATKFADDVLSNAKQILVFIPTNNPNKLMDVTSFERIVGDIYVDEKDFAEIMRDHGYEKKDK